MRRVFYCTSGVLIVELVLVIHFGLSCLDFALERNERGCGGGLMLMLMLMLFSFVPTRFGRGVGENCSMYQ